jgi:transcriptional regulator with XRE-family HTH domain
MDELGEFLRSRRARLSPAEAGVRTYGDRRRVPGLRREELAQLAGVSVAYYTRLEQGLSRNASDGVLDALARALRLDDDETTHLRALARPPRAAARRPRPRPERARPAVRSMLASLADVPALLIGRRTDVLGWNPMGHALIFGHLPSDAPEHPDTRPNMIQRIFCDPHVGGLYEDWRTKATDAVAYLRLASGQHPDDPRITSLIGELTVNSPEFVKLWSGHAVSRCSSAVRTFLHPLVGKLTLNEEVMQLVADADQRVVLYTAEPDSASENGLKLLAGLVASAALPAGGDRAGDAGRVRGGDAHLVAAGLCRNPGEQRAGISSPDAP